MHKHQQINKLHQTGNLPPLAADRPTHARQSVSFTQSATAAAMISWALMFLPILAASAEATEAALRVVTDASGNFTVTLNGKLWLTGGETRAYGYSSSEGTLKLLSQVEHCRRACGFRITHLT